MTESRQGRVVRRVSNHASTLDDASKLDLYKTAYEEGKRALVEQLGRVDAIRTRAVQVMALVTSATAFLVGTAAPARGYVIFSDTTNWLGVVLGCMNGVSLLLMISLLLNIGIGKREEAAGRARFWKKYRLQHISWKQGVSASALVTRWIDPEIGKKDPQQYYRMLALKYGEYLEDNEPMFLQTLHIYQAMMLTSLVTLFGWVVIVVSG